MAALVDGQLRPKNDGFSKKHDLICLSIAKNIGEIGAWVIRSCIPQMDEVSIDGIRAEIERPIIRPVRYSKYARPPFCEEDIVAKEKTVGYVDVLATCDLSYRNNSSEMLIVFEVKPTITSLGSTLRQAHRYVETISDYENINAGDILICIVSSSVEYKDAIVEKGHQFIDVAWLKGIT